MAFKVLLIENRSAVGAALFKGFEDLQHSLIVPDFSESRWEDKAFVERYLQDMRPAIIINPSAYRAVNAASTGALNTILPDVCAQFDLTLIHLSSHLVFPASTGDEVLSEQDEPHPETGWGEQLLHVERAVARVKRNIVLRLPWLLDTADGIIFQVAEALLEHDQINASDKRRGTPVFIDDVVRAVIAMAQQILSGAENWGVFHFHSSDSCSEAEFADYVSRILYRKGCEIGQINVGESGGCLLAGNGWLVGNRCTNCFGIQFRSWRQGTKGRLEYWLDKKFAEGVIQQHQRFAKGVDGH